MAQAPFTRRAFLQKGLTLVSAAPTVPLFLQRSAFGLVNPFDLAMTASVAGMPEDRVLVVVQLAGGNDGLNTVVPYGMDEYHRNRPGLRLRDREVLKLSKTDGLGLHPNLTGLANLYDQGLVGIVQGVGYPNPNRSHFTSTDVWNTADPENPTGHGWLGRYFDHCCNGSPEADAGIAIGRTAPPAMIGERYKPVAFETAELYRWMGEEMDPALADGYERLAQADAGPGANPQLAFLTRTALDARVSSDRIRAAVEQTPAVEYPRHPLASQLRGVAAMIGAGLPTRVYYVTLSGFDTHANQAGPHAALLRTLGDSLRAFYDDLRAQGHDGRVLTMTFSEFGRRVRQNNSGGTDHGAAAPMFLIGPMVRPGVLGRHPSLTDLDDGDLKHTVDFRNVYAAILNDWLRADVRTVLGERFRPARILKD